MNSYQTMANTGRNMGDQVIYYRRPMLDKNGQPAENAGWIVWGDSTSGTKLRDYSIRGFTPIFDYGAVNSSANIKWAEEHGVKPTEWPWIPILRHPKGPAEFPVDQILSMRWYRPENCPVEDVVFPQLKGIKIKEYRCPECKRPAFVDNAGGVGAIYGLGTHLRIMHGWDRVSLMAYGDRIGVDFNAVDVMNQLVQEYDTGENAEPRVVRRRRAEPQVEIEVV